MDKELNRQRERDQQKRNAAAQTRISRGNMMTLKKSELSPEEIAQFLEEGALYRSFEDVLKKLYKGPNLKKDLVNMLVENTGASRDSAKKNISNWIRDDEVKMLHAPEEPEAPEEARISKVPQRPQLFQLCFAMKLTEQEANELLASASDTKIHYRDPEELVYAYCLRTGKSWAQANALLEATEDIRKDIAAQTKKTGSDINTEDDDRTYAFTRQIHMEFEDQVKSDEKLIEFLRSHRSMLGELHATAYHDFKDMMKLLQKPEPELKKEENKDLRMQYEDLQKKDEAELTDEEQRFMKLFAAGEMSRKKVSVSNVVDQYLKMSVPAGRSKKEGKENRYKYLRRVIRTNWPTADILNKIQIGSMDVSRKIMLLLHLLTAEFEVKDSDNLPGEKDEVFDDWYVNELEKTETPAERMEIRVIQMNMFLDRYGMAHIDPGNPFDCLVLYALRASLEDEAEFETAATADIKETDDERESGETMGTRLEAVLKTLFREE